MIIVQLGLMLILSSVAPPSMNQNVSGWCNPVFNNVIGNITVTCNGVDPRALKRLNAELSNQKRQLSEKIQEADQWAARYHALENRLNDGASVNPDYKNALELLHQGEIEKAGSFLDKALLKEEVNAHRIADIHYNRALVYGLEFKTTESLGELKAAFHFDPDSWQYAQEYVHMLLDLGYTSDAEEPARKAVNNARKLPPVNLVTTDAPLAQALGNLAIVYLNTHRTAKAEVTQREALDACRQIADQSAELSTICVGATSYNLASLFQANGNWKDAESYGSRAFKIFEQVEPQNPMKYSPWVAVCARSLARTYRETGRTQEAQASIVSAVTTFRRLARDIPGRYDVVFGNVLNEQGLIEEDLHAIAAAGAGFREAIGIYRAFRKIYPMWNASDLAISLGNLGNVYVLSKEPLDAENAYSEAVEIFRSMHAEEQQEHSPEIAGLLDAEGNLSSNTLHRPNTEELFLEGLAIRRRLAALQPSMYTLDEISSLNDLASFYLKAQRSQDAVQRFQEALSLSRSLASKDIQRYGNALAYASNGLAEAYLKIGDKEDAAQEADEGLEISRAMWRVNPSVAGDSLARSLITAGDIPQSAATRCQLELEAARVASDPNLIDIAHRASAAYCSSH